MTFQYSCIILHKFKHIFPNRGGGVGWCQGRGGRSEEGPEWALGVSRGAAHPPIPPHNTHNHAQTGECFRFHIHLLILRRTNVLLEILLILYQSACSFSQIQQWAGIHCKTDTSLLEAMFLRLFDGMSANF